MEHIETHFHRNTFQCKTCMKTFKTRHNIRSHKRRCFRRLQKLDPSIKKSMISKNEVQTSRKRNPDEFIFKSNIFCNIEEFDKTILENMEYNEAPNGRSSYRCKKCGLQGKKSNLLEHIETHFHGNILFQCRTCLDTFKNSQRIRHHKLRQCSRKQQISESGFNDSLTEKNEQEGVDRKVNDDFTFKSDVLRSIEDYDEMILENMEQIGKYSFRCKECGKVALRSHTLEHIETHFQGNIFQCNDCQKNCASRGIFRRHKRKCLGNFFDQNKDYFVFDPKENDGTDLEIYDIE